jgi:predicted acylesterase/phospholipase RssA
MPFVHIDGNGAATRFAPQDERLISNARMRGDRSVRVTDVQLPNGQILQFEVRFDTNATSKRWHTPPTSGMIQVNLRNDNTRLVEYRLEEDQLTAGRKAVSAAADSRAAGEPELEPGLEPEPEREPEPDADRSLWECSFEETWKPYSDDIQAKLRAAYAADPTSTCHFEETRHFPAKGRYQAKTETFKYSVDFSAGPDFRQLNLKSNKERPVRRLGCWCRTPDARAAADSAPLRILCIDGGGSKGLVPAIIMQRIEQMCAPHRVDELFDVVAGTSTGGILALGTCIARVPAAEMAKVYETRADEIWTKKGGLTGFLSPVAAKASYDAQKLECILKEYSVTPRPIGGYGGGAGAAAAAAGRQLRMDEPHPGAPKTFVVAAKEGEAAAEPFTQFLFRSYASPAFGGTEGRSDCEVWQAGRATSAAPTYFDPYEVGSESYVDGGVLANNPVQVAIDEAQDLYPQRRIGLVVSLGCGITQREYDHKAGGGMAGEVRKFASQLTSTEPFHRKVLESLRVISVRTRRHSHPASHPASEFPHSNSNNRAAALSSKTMAVVCCLPDRVAPGL